MQVFCAYHEAGHAVVGHVIGRCIAEVSIASRRDGYGGYCRFHPMIEDANGHPQWRGDLNNPDLIAIYYAGMLATAGYCAQYVTFSEEESCVEYPEGSERRDLEQIQNILAQIGADEQQRQAITDASWMQAQKILLDYQSAVTALAEKLVKRETLDGKEAHRLIWQTIGYPDADWRLQALGIERERS